jgi:hypothetical protein
VTETSTGSEQAVTVRWRHESGLANIWQLVDDFGQKLTW